MRPGVVARPWPHNGVYSLGITTYLPLILLLEDKDEILRKFNNISYMNIDLKDLNVNSEL